VAPATPAPECRRSELVHDVRRAADVVRFVEALREGQPELGHEPRAQNSGQKFAENTQKY
jgi:hypothetical protein